MKYVRTKYGVYEVEKKERAYFKGQPWLYYLKGKYNVVEEKDILKQADTLKELIDEYVCVMPSGETFLLDKNTDLKAQVNYVGDVYGEIWVDGELHKVAKINEKGELELL